ncbi:MAG: hypothetical protein RL328_60 [Acidobacteriota bacterium]
MDELYESYGRLVYSLIHRIVGDTAAAEDLTQETFLRIWTRFRAFDVETGALGPWILAVARGRALDYLRSPRGQSADFADLEHPSRFTAIDDRAFSPERARKLKDTFEALAPGAKNVLELACYDGLSLAEIGERTQHSEAEAASTVRAALGTLREGAPLGCEPWRESYDLFALGLIGNTAEHASIAAHLEQGCAECRAAMHDALARQTLLLMQAPEVLPPVRLKRRVLGVVGIQPMGWMWFAAVCAAAMLVTALWFGVVSSFRRQQRDEARAQLAETITDRDRLRANFRFFENPQTRQVRFGGTGAPQGNVYVQEQLGVLLVAANLPQVPAGRIFEMWILPKHGAPRPAGLFRAGAEGSAVHVLGQRLNLAEVDAIAVSVEPVAGSPIPTAPVLFTVPIS